jgi:hypothetical protein
MMGTLVLFDLSISFKASTHLHLHTDVIDVGKLYNISLLYVL